MSDITVHREYVEQSNYLLYYTSVVSGIVKNGLNPKAINNVKEFYCVFQHSYRTQQTNVLQRPRAWSISNPLINPRSTWPRRGAWSPQLPSKAGIYGPKPYLGSSSTILAYSEVEDRCRPWCLQRTVGVRRAKSASKNQQSKSDSIIVTQQILLTAPQWKKIIESLVGSHILAMDQGDDTTLKIFQLALNEGWSVCWAVRDGAECKTWTKLGERWRA